MWFTVPMLLTTTHAGIVYRVEHAVTGEGPYQFEWEGLPRMSTQHSFDQLHPSPWADPMLAGIDSSERCGCVSKGALATWFSGWWTDLHAAGFVVKVIRADDVREGMLLGQVLFRYLSGCTTIDIIPIPTFVEEFA